MTSNDDFLAALKKLGDVRPLPKGKYAPPVSTSQRHIADNKRKIRYSAISAELSGYEADSQKSPFSFVVSDNPSPALPETSFKWCDKTAKARLVSLQQGKLATEGVIDLHGYRLLDAANELESYLNLCVWQQKRVVLIIHGKGSVSTPSVIKSHIPLWLKGHPAVLAFVSAPRNSGGTGAVLVLLRKTTSHSQEK